MGAHADEVIFTSGGTESDNLAIQGVINAYAQVDIEKDVSVGPREVGVSPRSRRKTPHIITTNIEHSAVRETCHILKQEGRIELTEVPVEANGIVRPEQIKKTLKRNTILVSIMYANNEIGTIQPIREIAKIIRHHRKITHYSLLTTRSKMAPPFLHTDATQAINYLPIKIEKLGVDLLTFNGTKIYGPCGIGILYKKRGVSLSPIFYGGSQEFGLRPGTENMPAIAGIAEALKITEKLKEKESKRLTKLRNYFIDQLQSKFPDIIINGDKEHRLPNNVNISIHGIESELLVLELDARGIAVSSKSACKSDDPEASYVIKALRDGDDTREGSVRFSLGRRISKREIDYVIVALGQILEKIHKWTAI